MNELTQDEKKALFDSLTDAKNRCLEAQADLREAIRAIAIRVGKGPFLWEGDEVLFVKARGRNGFAIRVKSRKAEVV